VGKRDTGTGRSDGKGANGSTGGLNAPNGNFNGVPAAAAPVTPASGCTSARTVDRGLALWLFALAVVALLARRRPRENA
jgi:MYXO-CTERM domain-containing protein